MSETEVSQSRSDNRRGTSDRRLELQADRQRDADPLGRSLRLKMAFKFYGALWHRKGDQEWISLLARGWTAADGKRVFTALEAELSGSYFSQTLLIDYMEEYVLPFPTIGAKNRFRNVLFVEKEGFHPILQAARLQERFDVALMSTKGMSVTAARRLLDELGPRIDRIFVLHDFDRSGFSIAGTLSQNSRRYTFLNSIKNKFVDIGLRLPDVEALGLQSEPVPQDSYPTWLKRSLTLRRHGASEDEIAFLRDRRVEINAMTSRQLIDFIERKFKEHGVEKVIPGDDVLEQQARRTIAQRLAAEIVAKTALAFTEKAKRAVLPFRLSQRVAELLEQQPTLSWDLAVAQIIVNEDREGKP